MESVKNEESSGWFQEKWQQKLSALIIAFFMWFAVNHTIISTKTIPNIPIRIINVPGDKAIAGMLTNGIYNKRITLTLSGNKSVVENLEPGEIEVLLDAAQKPDVWVVQINKKNLVSLNPDIDLSQKISSISQPDFVINMSPLKVEEIPIFVETPTGNPPKGYQFLDIWPRKLTQTLSGPESDIDKLSQEGVVLQFNLNNISKEDLDSLSSRTTKGHDDEVTFLVPNPWKKIEVPSLPQSSLSLTDPQSEFLRIDFLKESLIPLEQNLPIMLFYPLDASSKINPKALTLKQSRIIQEKDGIPYLNIPLFVSGASRRFVEVVRPYLSITINARAPRSGNWLQWNVQAVNPKALEDQYVHLMMSDEDSRLPSHPMMMQREKLLRTRFREYLQNLRLYVGKQRKLKLNCMMRDGQIEVSNEDYL